MKQTLHLLVLAPDKAEALATWLGTQWVLPMLVLPELVRPGPLVAEWAARIGLRAEVVGQWVGRPARGFESIDWLMTVKADAQPVMRNGLQWIAIDALNFSASWIDYQQRALGEVTRTSSQPRVPGPFGSTDWPNSVRQWIEGIVGPTKAHVTSYRTTAYEVVLGLSTCDRRVFFRGIPEDRAEEATMARLLARIRPDAFAPTLALERRDDGSVWWLTGECPGAELASSLTIGDIEKVAIACVELQSEASRHQDELQPHATLVDLPTMTTWAADLLRDRGLGHAVDPLWHACDAIHLAPHATTLIPVDLDPGNVFVDRDHVRFIDLDAPHWGPAPLALSTFVRRVARLSGNEARASEAGRIVRRVYAERWPEALPALDLWPALDVASAVLEAHLASMRVQSKVRRGELAGVEDLVRTRIAQRLSRAIDEWRTGDAHLRR